MKRENDRILWGSVIISDRAVLMREVLAWLKRMVYECPLLLIRSHPSQGNFRLCDRIKFNLFFINYCNSWHFWKNWMVVLTLWCSSWYYDVHMYNIYEQNKRLLKRWWSWHYDVCLDIKKACTADLFPAKTNHAICFDCDLIRCDLWWASTDVHSKNYWFSVSRHSK